MTNTIQNYMTAEVEGEFVVFLTGMRLNRWWKVWKWFPLFFAMPRMTRELFRNPELGMLHHRYHFGLTSILVIQYWKSFDHLHAYATDKSRAHIPAWRWMNKAVGLNGDIGTWHETYVIKQSAYEALYVNMPEYGLGKAGVLSPARGQKRTARGRMGQQGSDWSDLGVNTPATPGKTAAPAAEPAIPVLANAQAGPLVD